MPRLVKYAEQSATRRRAYLHLVETDGITPATGEAGGQPQVSYDGKTSIGGGTDGWTDDGIGVLIEIGEGRYYAVLTTAAVAVPGTTIETRYRSGATAECPGDTVLVVSFDPYATATVESVSPVSSGGTLSLVRGDDYLDDDGRAPTWTADAEDQWPDLTGAAVTLYVGALELAGVVVTPTGLQRVRVDVDALDTVALTADRYHYDLRAELASGHVVTLAEGQAVLAD